MNILHLSHTDIRVDSRILKEMHSINLSNDLYKVSGIGISKHKNISTSNNMNGLHIDSINIRSLRFTFLAKMKVLIIIPERVFKMLFKAIKLKPKIIHCHDDIVLLVGIFLKFFTGAKIIYDAHELESNKNGISKISSKLIFYKEFFLWKYIDALIVVSPSIEKWYKDNMGEKQSEIILNSPIVGKDISSISNDYFRKYFSIPKYSKIFLYIGMLTNGRGIELIIEAFKRNDVKSSLVFLGSGDLSEELEEIAQKYPNIYVHDVVSHEKVVSIAKSADVGLCFIENVSLSDYYCLPNKLFEYVFSGIPVLASDFPDISKIIEKYNLGKCSNLDTEGIYSTIKEFEKMDNIPIIETKKIYELSWEAQEKKLIKLYEMLIKD